MLILAWVIIQNQYEFRNVMENNLEQLLGKINCGYTIKLKHGFEHLSVPKLLWLCLKLLKWVA